MIRHGWKSCFEKSGSKKRGLHFVGLMVTNGLAGYHRDGVLGAW